MKACTLCKEIKEDEVFSVIKRNEDGTVKYRNSWCNPCKTQQRREKQGVEKRPVKVVTDTHKECTKCHEVKPYDKYSVTKRYEDGTARHISSWCNECRSNAEIEKRGGRVKPIPKIEGDAKECLMCRQMLILEMFSPSTRGRLGRASYCRECSTERLVKDAPQKERQRKYVRAYRKRHHSRWKAMHRIHQFNRRNAIKATEDGTLTDAFLVGLYNTVNCYWCNKETAPEERTLEHIIELSAGGTHSADNAAMACFPCNAARKGKMNGRN